MDRLEAMSIIIAVTETGSISAAARRLKSPVATVSRKVAELEARLKAQLFLRASRRMTLLARAGLTSTPAGGSSNRWMTQNGKYPASTGFLKASCQ
jgi:DNA-binding transcriptional LysR family regulator